LNSSFGCCTVFSMTHEDNEFHIVLAHRKGED
jgi:hypothetical protein